MNFKNKKLIPFAIFGGLLLIAVIIRLNPPESQQRPAFSGPVMTVETRVVAETSYPIMLESYGTVQPRTRSMLVAQVGGQIVSVNENVRNGGFFEERDVLATIDPRDYEADVRISGAVLMDARQALAEAEARTNQAREDWSRLGNTGEAPDLVLRIPLIDLPESYRFANVSRATGGRVEIHSNLGGEDTWDAVLVRTEGAIDETARQLHVIAQIDDPFGRSNEDQAPLKIGEYVTAKLEGMTIPNALVIPNNTIYQGSYVYTVEDDILRRRDIEIDWQNDVEAIIGAGLAAGDDAARTSDVGNQGNCRR